MSSCLGIYVDKNLIKYAKVKKYKNTFKLEAFNVEVYEDFNEAIEKIISDTSSYRTPISINISNELYNYFDVFSILDKKDITKSLDIEFEMLCVEKGYDKSSLESRYILRDNSEDEEKYKSLYISANKAEINEKVKQFEDYRLFSMSPVSTSITNLINIVDDENVAVLNLENDTKLTTVIDGQIARVDILNTGLEKAVEEINKIEMSWKKSYDTFKNITIYDHEVQSLDESENEYIEVVMPVLNKIVRELKKLLESFNEKVTKIYITGMGATISNIDLFIQDNLKNVKCEILKPFFIDATSLRVPVKEHIEVNSAIAIALDGIGYINKELNFAPISKFDNIEIENIKNTKENYDAQSFKEELKMPFSIKEKILVRAIAACVIAIIVFSCYGGIIVGKIKKQEKNIATSLEKTTSEIDEINLELSNIESYINAYNAVLESANSLNNSSTKTRTISKDAIPNMLNKIMFIIPQQVQLISIENTEGKHIVIEAVSEKYEQLGYFLAAIKSDDMFENIQSTTGTKSDSLVQITIEGDLK